MESRPRSLTLDNNSAASNPGRVRVQYLRYFRSFPAGPLIYTAVILTSMGLAAWYDDRFRAVIGVSILLGVFGLVRLKEHFQQGCIVPAIILSVKPPLIAAFTDLSTSPGKSWPAIRILRHSLAGLSPAEAQPGAHVAAIALYQPPVLQSRWTNFGPKLVNAATTDPMAIQRVFHSIPPDEWKELGIGLLQVPTPDQPGLYVLESVDRTTPDR